MSPGARCKSSLPSFRPYWIVNPRQMCKSSIRCSPDHAVQRELWDATTYHHLAAQQSCAEVHIMQGMLAMTAEASHTASSSRGCQRIGWDPPHCAGTGISVEYASIHLDGMSQSLSNCEAPIHHMLSGSCSACWQGWKSWPYSKQQHRRPSRHWLGPCYSHQHICNDMSELDSKLRDLLTWHSSCAEWLMQRMLARLAIQQAAVTAAVQALAGTCCSPHMGNNMSEVHSEFHNLLTWHSSC